VATSRYPPTATHIERIALGALYAVALIFLLFRWYVAAGAAFVSIVATLVAQQRRGNRARRTAINELKRELPAMTRSERRRAVQRFRERFPDAWSRRELREYLAEWKRRAAAASAGQRDA
jgi:hypothetical protein